MVKTKRVYQPPEPGDGERILVERLWPRGTRETDLAMAAWLKEAAPTSELRKWFSHDPAKWEEFRERYFRELEQNSTAWEAIRDAARRGDVTLLYSTHDEQHNSAVALAEFIKMHL